MTKPLTVSFFLTLAAFLAITAAPSAATEDPGIRHTFFMAGSIVESSAEGVYICIGSKDGATVGQQLDVVHITRVGSPGPKGHGVRFKREKVGTVRIDAIVDEHFAQATVTSGRAEKGDIVRLADPAEAAAEK